MTSPRKGRRGVAEQAPAEFYARTRDLLQRATSDRDPSLLRRAALRVDSARFNDLTDDQQFELLVLYSDAMAANGALSP